MVLCEVYDFVVSDHVNWSSSLDSEFFSSLNEQEDVELFEPEEYIAQRDKVVVLIKYRGRVRATGKTVESDLVHLFTFANGKIKRFREYYDTAATLDAYRAAASRGSGT